MKRSKKTVFFTFGGTALPLLDQTPPASAAGIAA
jgi:hypothetical protein